MKVKFLTSLVGLDINYQTGVVEKIEEKEAYSLISHGICEPADKASKERYLVLVEQAEKELEEKEENEKRAAAILGRQNLEEERANLQIRIDAITHILDDAKTYYLPYAGLVDDLLKQEAKNVNESNENKKDDLPQGEGK